VPTILKKIGIIAALFILFTGLMLARKGFLTKEKLLYLVEMILVTEQEKSYSPTKEKQNEELLLLVEEIEKEKEEITIKKEELKQFNARLLVQEEELRERGKEILILRNEAENYIKQKKEHQTEEMSWLAGVYEKMSAEEAASIIQELNENLSLAILSQMEEKQVAKILEAMSPQQAARLSQKVGSDSL